MPTWKGIIGAGFTPEGFDNYIKTVSFNTWRPQFVVLHNTASPKFAQWHDVPGTVRMRNLESFYRDTQKWSGGPHLFVADDLIWVFTPLNLPGVHSPSWNSLTWGVEMVGDYATEVFHPGVRANAVHALATLHATLGLDPSHMRMHREDPLTTHACPGTNVEKQAMIHSVLDELAARHPGEHPPER